MTESRVSVAEWERAWADAEAARCSYVAAKVAASAARARQAAVVCGASFAVPDFVPGYPEYGSWREEVECRLPLGHDGDHDGAYDAHAGDENAEYRDAVCECADAEAREVDELELWVSAESAFHVLWCGPQQPGGAWCRLRRGHDGPHQVPSVTSWRLLDAGDRRKENRDGL